MEAYIPSVISAVVSIAVAIITGFYGVKQSKFEKTVEIDKENQLRLAEMRKKENLLAMKLSHANTQLTLGVAMAVKTGHANGEIERGLQLVNAASTEYDSYIQEIANDHLQK